MYIWKGLAAEIIARGKERKAQRPQQQAKRLPWPLLSRMGKLCLNGLSQKA